MRFNSVTLLLTNFNRSNGLGLPRRSTPICQPIKRLSNTSYGDDALTLVQ